MYIYIYISISHFNPNLYMYRYIHTHILIYPLFFSDKALCDSRDVSSHQCDMGGFHRYDGHGGFVSCMATLPGADPTTAAALLTLGGDDGALLRLGGS